MTKQEEAELAAAAISAECDSLKAMLLEKNRQYGNSAFNPSRIFSKCGVVEAINVRMDDKISRMAKGELAGEDAEMDLIGYAILKRAYPRYASLVESSSFVAPTPEPGNSPISVNEGEENDSLSDRERRGDSSGRTLDSVFGLSNPV